MDPTAALKQLGICEQVLAARGLQPFDEAKDLVIAETGSDGRDHLLTPEAASAWRQMARAAQREGISLWIVSAFRSVDRQFTLVRTKLDAGADLDSVLTVSAPPGYSEHHSGRAVDVGTHQAESLDLSFAVTDAFQWLMRRGSSFGFLLSYPAGNANGYEYEPWHWCYHAPNLGRGPMSMAARKHEKH